MTIADQIPSELTLEIGAEADLGEPLLRATDDVRHSAVFNHLAKPSRSTSMAA